MVKRIYSFHTKKHQPTARPPITPIPETLNLFIYYLLNEQLIVKSALLFTITFV